MVVVHASGWSGLWTGGEEEGFDSSKQHTPKQICVGRGSVVAIA